MNPNYNDDVLDVVGIVFMAIIYGVFGGIPAFIIVWLFGYLWGIALFATLSFLAVCIHLSSNCKYSDVVGYGYALSGAANILTVALILFSGIYPLLLIAIPLFFCWYLGFQKYRKEAEEYLN